jgi:uncharacterized RDD family membrane protein YckC/Zn finger protein HypA/HybF involved in hydrogenase expression
MPVKVKCPKCSKVLNAPEAARGKAVKCPECESKVPVPAGDGSAGGSKSAAKPGVKSAAAKPSGKPAPRQKTAEDDDFLSGLDLGDVEDRETRVCPKCGCPLEEFALECPKCGTDPMTGGLGRTAKRKERIRQMGGADPNEFYKFVWKDSWSFVMQNRGLVVRTGVYWTVFNLLLAGSSFLGMKSWMAGKPPVAAFFALVAVISAMGVPGWYWYLSNEIVRKSLSREEMDRVNFDFFSAVALGFKSYVWMYVLSLTSIFLPGILPLIVFPLAMIHMAMPYTYKAWIGWEMAKLLVQNIGQVLYWWVVFIAVQLPVIAIAGAIGYFVAAQNLAQRSAGWLFASASWLNNLTGMSNPVTAEQWNSGEVPFMFMAITALFATLYGILVIAPYCFLAAGPAVFMMSATGCLAANCRPKLDLVMEQKHGILCGFWVRFLAHLVDLLLVGGISGGGFLVYLLLTLISKPEGIMGIIQFVVAAGLQLFAIWFYYAKGESGSWQGTLGKKSLGIIVTDMKGNRITQKAATIRFFVKFTLSGLFLNAGFIMAGLTEKKQALHDLLAKTLVVWHGDE